jgi:hypothetical protein
LKQQGKKQKAKGKRQKAKGKRQKAKGTLSSEGLAQSEARRLHLPAAILAASPCPGAER